MRAVVDTNVLISALLSVSGPPAVIINAWRQGRFDLVTGSAQVEEFKRATRYATLASYISRAEAGVLVNGLRKAEVFLRRLPEVRGSADPDDDFLLAMAVAGKADYLVTGDRRGLLSLKRIGTTRIVTARQFANELLR